MQVNRKQVIGAAAGLVALAAFAPTAYASPASGLAPTTFATANLDHTLNVQNGGVSLRTKVATTARVQEIIFAVGASSGWHHHPGVVMVVVAKGSVTVWNAHCQATTYGVGLPDGAAFFESGDEPNLVTSTDGATNYVTYLVPKVDPPVFRVEDSAPACAL